ncbi:uncharacterized protein LOC128988583 [Macrosteles quadrilineatus]|uniref:uncharacterized protein LOC128988583 n=1 Tax=Macrosteles quadrilineatus TaxID=74068 RepID=UPI0023E1AF43|nr:uncharacterized protein LOC128988583 [Macrosteles quadrilineatus]
MAPANVPTADKPPTVDKSPADMSSASAPQPDTADPDVAIRDVEDSLKKLRIKLNDAVSAIVAPAANTAGQFKAAEASVGLNIPEISIKPVEVTANKKYAEIIGQFIADLIQIPIVLLHAFGEAVAGLTGSKQPQLIYPGQAMSSVSVAVPPAAPYKVDKP